jgi:hypothetical protein
LLFSREFRAALESYPFASRRRGALPALVVPPVELCLGLALTVGAYWRIAALATTVLIGIFTFSVIWALRAGKSGNCGCGGLIGSNLGVGLLARNALFALTAAGLALSQTTYAAFQMPQLALQEVSLGFNWASALLVTFTPVAMALLAVWYYVRIHWLTVMVIAREEAAKRGETTITN